MNSFKRQFDISFSAKIHNSTENIASQLSQLTVNSLLEMKENQNYRQRFLEMACLCRLAYIAYEQTPITIAKSLQAGNFFSNYQFLEIHFLYSDENTIFGSEPVCCGYVALTNEEIIVVLRGTKNIGDWLLNCCVNPNSDGFHSGFASYAASVWRQLNCFFSASSPSQRKLTIVGHSLGGAAAILIALLLQKQEFSSLNVDEVEIYSFGSPPFNTKNISLNVPLYRIRTSKDLVPYLPQLLSKLGDWLPYIPESLSLYQHIWPEYLIQDNYNIYQVDKSLTKNLWTPHLIQEILRVTFQNRNYHDDFDPFSKLMENFSTSFYSEHQTISYIKKLNYGSLPSYLSYLYHVTLA